MKNKKYIGFLLIEALAVLALTFSDTVKKESIFSVLSMPITFIADNLGKLSLSGDFGNTVSVIIYSLICLAPVFLMLFKISRKTFVKEDCILVALSAVLFPLIYFLINPAEMGAFGMLEMKVKQSALLSGVSSAVILFLNLLLLCKRQTQVSCRCFSHLFLKF